MCASPSLCLSFLDAIANTDVSSVQLPPMAPFPRLKLSSTGVWGNGASVRTTVTGIDTVVEPPQPFATLREIVVEPGVVNVTLAVAVPGEPPDGSPIVAVMFEPA